MISSKFTRIAGLGLAAMAFAIANQVRASSVLVVASDGTDISSNFVGLDGITSATFYDAEGSTPTLAYLESFNAILTYSNFEYSDPVTLGDELKQYVDAGTGNVVISTYALSSIWAIGGGITDPGYSPLVNVGVDGLASGALVATVPSDPIFNGVNVSNVTYYNNGNLAHAAVGTGATLLATDGAGVNMVAVNAAGDVYADNFYLGLSADANTFQLVANELTDNAPPSAPAPDASSTALLFGLGSMASAFAARKFKQRA